jgi:hypothetical protein
MTARELLETIPCPPGCERESRLYFRILSHFLAEHLYELEILTAYGRGRIGDGDITRAKIFFTDLNAELERELGGRKKSA